MLVQKRRPTFVNYKNEPVNRTSNIDSAEKVFLDATNEKIPNIANLSFWNPKEFTAGQIHQRTDQWKKIVLESPLSKDILD